jgi:hypothetical protein
MLPISTLARSLRDTLLAAWLLPLVLLTGGCFVYYAPLAAPPGSYSPPASKGSGDFGIDLVVGRDMAYGAEVREDGTLAPDEDLPKSWLGLDLALRYGLSETVGLDLRLTSSALIPFPLPVPNGATVAPIFRVLHSDDGRLALHLSPRLLWSNGSFIAAIQNEKRETRVRALGAELPAQLTYRAAKWLSLSTTAYVRGYHDRATLTVTRDDLIHDPVVASYTAFGGGATLALIFTLGGFRLALYGGLEAGPDPGGGLLRDDGSTQPETTVLFGQGGLTLGGAWR